jgi:chitodextrinase
LSAFAVSYSQVDLSWSASTDNVGVAGYYIIRDGVTIASSPVNVYTDVTVSPVTSYSYYVLAYDANGNTSGPSNTVSVTTPQIPDTEQPTQPQNLVASAISSSQINLSWTASTDNIGVVDYDIYRDGNYLTSASTTSYGDTGLSPLTTYIYYVVAKDAASNMSIPSNSASATTQANTIYGTLTGTVSSSAGGVIAGAKITTGSNGNQIISTTDALGHYTLSLISGSHTVKFSAKNHLTSTSTVTIQAGVTTVLDKILTKK